MIPPLLKHIQHLVALEFSSTMALAHITAPAADGIPALPASIDRTLIRAGESGYAAFNIPAAVATKTKMPSSSSRDARAPKAILHPLICCVCEAVMGENLGWTRDDLERGRGEGLHLHRQSVSGLRCRDRSPMREFGSHA